MRGNSVGGMAEVTDQQVALAGTTPGRSCRRSIRLERTLIGAGVVHGELTLAGNGREPQLFSQSAVRTPL